MPEVVDIDRFLSLAEKRPVIDVRTPAEFDSGKIPGAVNVPLFSNEERAKVGTTYKQQGREPAIRQGLDLVGPKMIQIIDQAKTLGSKELLLYCWRGGMRSESVGWLLEKYGFEVTLLKDGYKVFRNKALKVLEEQRQIIILGGRTGSAKTLVLQELRKMGEQVLDLEGLANHKGSAFGALGENSQPSQEEFDNRMAWELMQADLGKRLWVEDESHLVGRVVINNGFWEQMRIAQVVYLDVSFRHRADYLVQEYGKFGMEQLKECSLKIRKRLGGLQLDNVIRALDKGELRPACEILLGYYDKTYNFGLSKREEQQVHTVRVRKFDPPVMAGAVLRKAKTL